MSTISLAPRMSRFKPSPSQLVAARVRELRAEGRDIISFTNGEPDFPTPEHVKRAAWEAMERNETKYTNVEGILPLREAIREKFSRENNLDYRTDEILVGAGAKQVIFDALMATVSQGDEVVIPAPYWTSYPDMVLLAGGQPEIVTCSQNNGFKMRPEDLEEAITPQTKWLMFSSPSNPCGACYTRDELKAIADVLLRHPHVWIMTDDIYEHFLFDGREFATIAEVEPKLKERTLTINGVSKVYAMTGWRIGYAGGPKPLIQAMRSIQSQSTAGPSAISQAAALAALAGPQDFVAERNRLMQERRDVLVGELNACEGLSCDTPEGAMYVFCSVAGTIGKRTPDGKTIENDTDFALYLLDHAGVAVVQGAGYGLSPYIRASFPIPIETLREGGRRIREACAALT